MSHPFRSFTPAQLRALPRQAHFSPPQQVLLSTVTTFAAQVLSRSPPSITLPELQTIMDYKLAFGQNRPTLRAMIRKNMDSQVKDCSRRAFVLPELQSGHWDRVKEGMDILCELKGVGPATASLILSLVYPEHIPFFSDEATVDVLSPAGGRKGIKYTMKTYKELFDALGSIAGSINSNEEQGAALEVTVGRGAVERAIWNTVRLQGNGEGPSKEKAKRPRTDDDVAVTKKRKRIRS
ncbi:uncharacterized protein BT62DRAFT_931224 [Guyanagaster necrorhizus]|uniref:Uncharacterized protein n=1 Tax=Guyanagaster necrorhizus TaxID=856835 RepID=A0A9P7VVC8_9AGAR|nr:uncharacterized protein BT62DRAFT_931224 [Guyanagaster necrorhizus MCA 3950]KAG7447385.1 hypothetical protein BT62DRAFT_931224 [Guyanagaster necrorhizus MCA 3950]